MSTSNLIQTLQFAPRRSNHYAQWAPLYIEPLVGSGERLCVAVAVIDSEQSVVYRVPGIERLTCVYGNQANALVHASNLLVSTVQRQLTKHGLDYLKEWSSPMEGAELGEIRVGAGEDFEDVARMAMMMCASLAVNVLTESEATDPDAIATETAGRLEKLVKQAVVEARPELKTCFGHRFRASEDVRAFPIGFVGQKFVANFGLLVPGKITPLIHNAKSKLWDLKHLKSGAMDDFFGTDNAQEFELLLYRPSNDEPGYTERQIKSLNEAVGELEAEADNADIRCRPMYSTLEIANFVLSKETA